MMKIKVIILFVFISSLALSSDYFLTKSILNLRSAPSTQSDIIYRIPKGDTIKALESINVVWIKLNYNNKIGYCSKTYLTPIEINETPTVDAKSTENEDDWLFSLLGIIIIGLIAILINFTFYKIGIRNRNKYIAALLALFFGIWGTHRYYLGQKNKGIIFYLFGWTFIPILVSIWDALKYTFWSKVYFDRKYQVVKGLYQTNKTKRTAPTISDNSLANNISREQKTEYIKMNQNLPTPPYWESFNIQSYSDIVKANYKQIEFYNLFKQEFKKGAVIPLKGISNYAYLLYFDLLSEFKIHKKKEIFEQQIDKLARIEPRIRRLATNHLDEIQAEKGQAKTTTTNHIKTNIIDSKSSDNKLIKPNNELFDESLASDVKDESIVDVNNEQLDLSINNQEQNQPPAPYWQHTYVYSYDEIRYASSKQKEFYKYFKSQVLKGEHVNINDNMNYAFVLYFDFFNEYKKHDDIKLLEEQFKLIGKICPKTNKYTLNILIDELRKRSDNKSQDKLEKLKDPCYLYDNNYSDFNPYLHLLGYRYKKYLNLCDKEVSWLNHIDLKINTFNSIEGCMLEIVKLYVFVLNKLENKFKTLGSSMENEISNIKKRYQISCQSFYPNYEEQVIEKMVDLLEENIYSIIFKQIENHIRILYNFKNKLPAKFLCVDKYIVEEFENKFNVFIYNTLEFNHLKIRQPDINTQIALNAQNVTRWQDEFNILKDEFKKENKEQFIEKVKQLEEVNQKNPNIENIFFEASKFIAKYDKVQSLKYYTQYINYDLKSVKFDNKDLTKTVQKSLFQTEEQINDFKQIIAELIETSDLNTALEKISGIYKPKRKKIKLDITEIKKVEQKHEGTVELLNDFLEVENDGETNNFSSEGEIEIVSPVQKESIFITEINMGKIEEELVKLIVENSYEISKIEVDNYAIKNNMFKNQLIDYINEACMEHLDGEALIEEDDNNYVIEKSYYQEISK